MNFHKKIFESKTLLDACWTKRFTDHVDYFASTRCWYLMIYRARSAHRDQMSGAPLTHRKLGQINRIADGQMVRWNPGVWSPRGSGLAGEWGNMSYHSQIYMYDSLEETVSIVALRDRSTWNIIYQLPVMVIWDRSVAVMFSIRFDHQSLTILKVVSNFEQFRKWW